MKETDRIPELADFRRWFDILERSGIEPPCPWEEFKWSYFAVWGYRTKPVLKLVD